MPNSATMGANISRMARVDLLRPSQSSRAPPPCSVDAGVLLGLLERAVRAAHDLDQVIVGDHVARVAVDDVVEARLALRSSRTRW